MKRHNLRYITQRREIWRLKILHISVPANTQLFFRYTKRQNQYYQNKIFRTYFKKFHNLPKSVSEISEKFYTSTQLSTHEYFIELCPCEHFKTSAKLHYQAFLCVCG